MCGVRVIKLFRLSLGGVGVRLCGVRVKYSDSVWVIGVKVFVT